MTHTFRAAMSLPLLAFAATPLAAQDAPDQAAVVETYANIAEAAYGDALSTARDLDAAIDAFLADPTEAGLEAARAAWRSARTPYMQTETYRFGNAIVDDWEGKVNAWPLDEGLIGRDERALLFNCASGLKYPLEDHSRLLDRHAPIDFATL